MTIALFLAFVFFGSPAYCVVLYLRNYGVEPLLRALVAVAGFMFAAYLLDVVRPPPALTSPALILLSLVSNAVSCVHALRSRTESREWEPVFLWSVGAMALLVLFLAFALFLAVGMARTH